MSCHFWVQTFCRAHSHAIQDVLTLSPRRQVHRTRRGYMSSHAFVNRWQTPYQQYLGTSRECFQLVSERTRERAAVRRLFLSYLATVSVLRGPRVRTFCTVMDPLSRTTDPSRHPASVVAPVSEVAITTDHHKRSGTSSATRPFSCNARSSDGRKYVTSKMAMNADKGQCLRRVICAAI